MPFIYGNSEGEMRLFVVLLAWAACSVVFTFSRRPSSGFRIMAKRWRKVLGRIYFGSVLAVPMHAYIALCHYLKLKKWRREMKEKQEQSCGKAAER